MTLSISLKRFCSNYTPLAIHIFYPKPRAKYSTDTIIQHFTLHFHTRHKRVFGQVVIPTAVLLVGSLHLFIQRLDVRGE